MSNVADEPVYVHTDGPPPERPELGQDPAGLFFRRTPHELRKLGYSRGSIDVLGALYRFIDKDGHTRVTNRKLLDVLEITNENHLVKLISELVDRGAILRTLKGRYRTLTVHECYRSRRFGNAEQSNSSAGYPRAGAGVIPAPARG